MSIHTIGDSHSGYGWVGIIQHHLGAVLCYSFGKEKLARCDIREFGIKDGDTIVFCLGEIDCRCHIHKHVTPDVTYQDIIDAIVNSYFEAIELNVRVSQLSLKQVCVYNVVPPIQKHNTPEDAGYPFLGTDADRQNYVLYFNKRLKERCAEYEYLFFDVYDKYADANGFLNKELSDGTVHIHNPVHIIQFMKEQNM